MLLGVLSLFVVFLRLGLGLAELPQWQWGQPSPGGEELEEMMGGPGPGETRPVSLLERGLSLDTCQVQRKVLERLRELVVESIDQVKRCLNPATSPYRCANMKSLGRS